MSKQAQEDFADIITFLNDNVAGSSNWGNQDEFVAMIQDWLKMHAANHDQAWSVLPMVVELAQISWNCNFFKLQRAFGDALFDGGFDQLLRSEANHIINLCNGGHSSRSARYLEIFFDLDRDKLRYQARCSDVLSVLRALAIDLGLGHLLPIIDEHGAAHRLLGHDNAQASSEAVSLKLSSKNTIKLVPDQACQVVRETLSTGTYEPTSIEVWEALAHEADIVVDVGANSGVYALIAATRYANKPVHAFEANANTIPSLSANVQLNACGSLSIHQTAIGAENGQASFTLLDGDCLDLASTLTKHHKDYRPNEREVEVELRTLDSVLPPRRGQRLLVKIDTEGGELDCIKGMQNWLEQGDHDLLIESFDQDNCTALTGILGALGYRFYRINEGSHRIQQVESLQPASYTYQHNFNQLVTRRDVPALQALLPDHCQVIS